MVSEPVRTAGEKFINFIKNVGLVAGVFATLGGGSLFVGGKTIVKKFMEATQAKAKYDSIQHEMRLQEAIYTSLHYDLQAALEQIKMDFYYEREQSKRHDNSDYYVVFDDGEKRTVDLRDVEYGRDPWAFLMDGSYRKYPARWSEASRRFVIAPDNLNVTYEIRQEND